MKLISLTKGQQTKVDDTDFDWLNKSKWQASWSRTTRSYYAVRSVRASSGKRSRLRMHTVIAGFPRPDHINGDTLDNQRRNLRPATRSQNGANARISKRNTSGFKGVSWHKQVKKWVAKIRVNRKLLHLGLFVSAEDAARAYDAAALKYFGEFARLNFPV